MKGDIIFLEPHHVEAGRKIVDEIILDINKQKRKYIITVSGESGSGKSETAKAISDVLEKHKIKSTVLGQDDYFVLPPESNDKKRREDDSWLGPHVEVKMELLNQQILDALNDKEEIVKPLISYSENSISEEKVKLNDVKVVIVEGTYTSLLRNVDCKVFINRNRLDTLEHRKKRNRGNEVNDTFIENVLKMEHKIIAGHQYMADIIITKDYQVSIK